MRLRQQQGARCNALCRDDRRHQKQTQRDPRRPGVDEDRHRGGDFLACEPVRHHFGHQHVEQHAADAGDNAPCDLPSPTRCECHREAARGHQRKAKENNTLVAEAASDLSARQCNHDARGEIKTDEKSDVAQSDTVFLHHGRRHRRHRLKLERHAQAHDEQQNQNIPALLHVLKLQPQPVSRSGAQAPAHNHMLPNPAGPDK